MPSDAEAADSPQTAPFEETLAELGELVSRLESGSLGLSESIAAYERGVTLLKRLHDELAAAELKVSTLIRVDADGRPVLTSGEAPQADEPASSAPRNAGRKQRSRTLPGMDDPRDAG
ncbi:MAG: exodeoxyribonuclease VII small subunit [Planctomycetota bacterium]